MGAEKIMNPAEAAEKRFVSELEKDQQLVRAALVKGVRGAIGDFDHKNFTALVGKLDALGEYLASFTEVKNAFSIRDGMPVEDESIIINDHGKSKTRAQLKQEKDELSQKRENWNQDDSERFMELQKLIDPVVDDGGEFKTRAQLKQERDALLQSHKKEWRKLDTERNKLQIEHEILERQLKDAQDDDSAAVENGENGVDEDDNNIALKVVGEKPLLQRKQHLQSELDRNRTELEIKKEESKNAKARFVELQKLIDQTNWGVNAALQTIIDDYKLWLSQLGMADITSLLAFVSVWRDEHLVEDIRRHLRVKSDLNRTTRRQISLALQFLAISSNGSLAVDASGVQQRFDEYSESIATAIAGYQTTRQAGLGVAGKVLAAIVAFASGLMTAVAMLGVLGMGPVGWIVAGVILVAGTAVNWNAFKVFTPRLLAAIAGGDSPLQGLLEFTNEYGERQRLSPARMVALAVSFLFSLSVGVTWGALSYGSIVGLSALGTQVAALSFLATATAAAILPPVAIVLVIATSIVLTFVMFRAFASMLRTESIKDMFSQPLEAVNKVFLKEAEANRNKTDRRLQIERYITLAVLGVIGFVGFVGLVLFSYTCSLSVADLLTGMLGVAPNIATGVGYFIGVVSFIGQLAFIYDAAATIVAIWGAKARDLPMFFKNLFAKNTSTEEVVNFRPTPMPQRSFSIWAQESFDTAKAFVQNKLVPSLDAVWGVVSKLINALGNGALAVPSMVPAFFATVAGLFNMTALFTGFLNSLNFGFSAGGVPNAAEDGAKSQAKQSRSEGFAKLLTEEQAELLGEKKADHGMSSSSSSLSPSQTRYGALFPFKGMPFNPAKLVNSTPVAEMESIFLPEIPRTTRNRR